MTYPEDEPDLETPEVDAAEQATSADPSDEVEEEPEAPPPVEAPEWDVQEQRQVVTLDDDYR
jgi:hypothetical protein